MARITDLPCELIACILGSLDDLQSLSASLFTCRHFYYSFKQSHGIQASVVRQQLTPALLPLAVAVMTALDYRSPCSHDVVYYLLETIYDKPSSLSDQLATMSPARMSKMIQRHLVIQELAQDFATEAWSGLGQDVSDDDDISGPVLSPQESFRFHRAFYRVELYYAIFRNIPYDATHRTDNSIHLRFFYRNKPWENEQIGCVHGFLETRLAEATFDILSHDVFFGEMSIDYLRNGRLNSSRQRWLSEGILFLHSLMCMSSYEMKRAHLMAYCSAPVANLPRALDQLLSAYSGDHVRMEGPNGSEILSVRFTRKTDEDTDGGPHEAWFAGHKAEPVGYWLWLSHNDWLRDHAYVLWDHERIEAYDLLETFEFAPKGQGYKPEPTDEELDEMEDSFDERSYIWQMGGSGYWIKGDTSRISWLT